MSDLVHSIHDIFEKKVTYYIPEYQRGYKWANTEVKKLLYDIDNFKADGDKFYCLQNITLVPKDSDFNVVDGQQRLTVLVILLSRLGLTNLVNKKIKYTVRDATDEFLSTYITGSTVKNGELDFNTDWKSFIETDPTLNRQDIYYIHSTVKTIDDFFKNKNENDKIKYKNKLLHRVKLIVNKINKGDNEERIFGKLNSKRIPLDGADLVRAILITRVANEESKKAGDIKNIVRVNERRVRIGWELDEINNWWSQEEVKGYFKIFIRNRSDGDVIFNADKYPINNLLLLFSEKKKKKSLSLDLIEEQGALELYKELIKLNNTLKDWYQDREIYHYLGYLLGQKILFVKDIFTKWDGLSDRTSFKTYLKENIKNSIFKNRSIKDIFNETEDWYHNHSNKLVKVLLVLDIVLSLPKQRTKLPHIAFTKNSYDIEHIFPQNPEDVKEKKEYIEYLEQYFPNNGDKFDLNGFEEKKDDLTFQEKMNSFIAKQMANIDVNSIGNLVLLYYSLNRSLGRITYAEKRARVIEYFNDGNFIQPHTFQVFVRYFTNKDGRSRDLERWTNDDIEANKSAIITTLTNFFEGN